MSSSKLLKCKNCNLVVNELLTFVQNKHEIMDSESLVRICTSAFTTQDINTAKSLLFQSVSTDLRNVKRKNKSKEGKANKDLYDVIDVFKQVDPEKIPIFVACDLNKLPPVSFDHVDVTRLLKDICILREKVSNIENTYATTDQLLQIRNEVCSGHVNVNNDALLNCSDNRNINFRRGTRGAYFASLNKDSGPTGLTFKPIIDHNLSTANISDDAVKPGCQIPSRSHSVIGASTSSPLNQRVHVEATTEVSRPADHCSTSCARASLEGSLARPTAASNDTCIKPDRNDASSASPRPLLRYCGRMVSGNMAKARKIGR